MKARLVLPFLLVLTSPSLAQPWRPAPPPLRPETLTAYPWTDSAPTARVPKELLPHLGFDSLAFSAQRGEPTWTPTEAFVRVFRLTPPETETLAAAVERAGHERRLAESRHLRAFETPPGLASYRAPDGLKVIEERHFVLEPYEEDLARIGTNLDDAVKALLGAQRTTEFWNRCLLGHSLRRPSPNSRIAPPAAGETWTFRLIEFQSRLSVDLVRVQAGGSSGGPHDEAADRYAPEALVPVLKRWRAAIAEYARTNPPPTPSPEPPPPSTSPTTAPKLAGATSDPTHPPSPPNAPWDDASPFVDIPKSLIPSLGVPGLEDHAVSPAATVLFGLTPENVRDVNTLYTELKDRFEVLEAGHLTRPGIAEGQHILRRFPDQAEPLKQEWIRRLATLVGDQRARLLHGCIIDPEPAARHALFGLDLRPRRRTLPPGAWPVWLLRGTREMQFEITTQPTSPPRVSLEYKDLDDEDGARGGMGGLPGSLPADWNHLFPPRLFLPTAPPGPVPL